ncbi:ABC transporter substrate-binding protein [Saccharomonospora xinjiangensis]|uniref:ABC-type sugar transport system, periplasmic component n=1 Tax=Saccharomonospora xinjiangensis XJ-54 TaxID=882086 RepID=I0V7D7_9PSEU|nr:extracellular solute-binding protein [Saccharomonospora xinjiangensis]EID56040.1 ABC-type sugar transport system, periplasmic component [Saccharomonospora xinjiangensis XJ-54]
MALGTRRRSAAFAAGAAAVLALSAACGTNGPAGGSGANSWALTGGDEQTIRSSFEQWNQDKPDHAIEAEFFANDAYKQKIRTSIGAGGAPTLIFGWGGGTLRDWVEADKVVPISELVEDEAALTERFLPSVLDTGAVDGEIYALPNNGMQPVLLYYNKKLFDRIGAEPPATWSELLDLVPRFTEQGIAPFAIGGQSRWPQLMWLEYLVDRLGGPEVFDAVIAGEPGAWSHPAVLKAGEMIRELVDAGGFVKGYNSIAADSGADAALLYTDKAAMYLMGSWAYPSIKDSAPRFIAEGHLGYTTFPMVEGGKGDSANIVGNPANYWAVSAEASEKERAAAAAYLTEGLMNDDYVTTLLENGSVPPLRGVESKLSTTDESDYLSFVYGLAENAPNFELSWDQALSPKQADALLTNLEQLFTGALSPEQFCSAMDATIEQK